MDGESVDGQSKILDCAEILGFSTSRAHHRRPVKRNDSINFGGGWVACIAFALGLVMAGTWGWFGLWVALAVVGGLLLMVVWVSMLLVLAGALARSAYAQGVRGSREAGGHAR